MRAVTFATARRNNGQLGGGDVGQLGGGDVGQLGGGDVGQLGGGDVGQLGGGDVGQLGGGDVGQLGGTDPSTVPGTNGQPRSAMTTSTAPVLVTVVGPVVVAKKLLRFRIEQQEKSEWCWAAVAVSIERYFNPRSKLKQCEVAYRVLQPSGGRECCCRPGSDCCDKPAELEDALDVIHKRRTTLERALTFSEVQREIDTGRPIGVGITWSSGNSAPVPGGNNALGHFVVVRGYRVLSSGARQVYIADPLNPSGLVDFDEFTRAYYGEGVWTETNLVQSGLA